MTKNAFVINVFSCQVGYQLIENNCEKKLFPYNAIEHLQVIIYKSLGKYNEMIILKNYKIR